MENDIPLSESEDHKYKMNILTNYIILGQKIDRIWVTFIYTYTAFFGLVIYYEGSFELEYVFMVAVVAIFFSYINGRALHRDYKVLTRLVEYLSNADSNRKTIDYSVINVPKNPYIVYFTHSIAALMLIYLVLDIHYF